ncbi:MAG: phosphopantetheine-binding protein [Candidatus Eremiobacteraeota bacterium]|nr:phosphopantetheine-binding protein [Candidatus Eremiobacteraeota bacterium]
MKVTVEELKELMREAGIAKYLVDAIEPDVPLLQQGLDSVDFPVVAVACEKKYGVDLSGAASVSLRTLNDFIAFVARIEK